MSGRAAPVRELAAVVFDVDGWMRMVTIPNQSSVPKAYEQCGPAKRMLPSAL